MGRPLLLYGANGAEPTCDTADNAEGSHLHTNRRDRRGADNLPSRMSRRSAQFGPVSI